MKTARPLVIVLFLVLAARPLPAEPAVSGYLDSSFALGAGAGADSGFIYGLEEYANIRLQARIRDEALFYGSFNLIAAAGTYARAGALLARAQAGTAFGLSPSALTAGENYAAALELERLYFKIFREKIDFQGGLTRIAFGYGLVFGPMDFLNPRNPLLPDARPRAVLGAELAWYPGEDAKIRGFTAAPRDPFAASGAGTLAGLAGEYHGERLSFQGLYSFESPGQNSPRGIHRAGLSAKADLAAGWVLEMLYTANPEAGASPAGLSAGAGLDYSLLDGKLIVLAEYLYNGAASSTSAGGSNGAGFSGEHLLYTGATWRYSDYTNFTLACLSGFSDISFAPILRAEHELFQGFILSLDCQIPLDRDLFSGNGKRGELGPLPPGGTAGRYFQALIKGRLRF